MKTKLWLLLCVGFLLVISSCTKEKVEEKKVDINLTGKWRLVEMYDGYANGGSFTWQPVSTANSHSLEFLANGQYLKKWLSGSNQQCSGTYQLLSNNLVEIISNCQSGGEKTTISELTNQNLILDYQVREGVIRYKYLIE